MTLRTDILKKVLQKTRGVINNLGLRTNATSVSVRTWTKDGNPAKPGSSGATFTDSTVELTPPPRVRALRQEDIASSGGRFQSGDLRVDRLTPRHATGGHDPEDLRPSVGTHQEIIYTLSGPNEGEYELVDLNTTKNFEYILILRLRRTTPFKGA